MGEMAFFVGRSSVVVYWFVLLVSVGEGGVLYGGECCMVGVAVLQASELREVRVGLGGRRAAALCSVRKL